MTSIRNPYAVPTTSPGQVQTQTTMLTGNTQQQQQQPQTTITVPKAPAVPQTLGAFGTTTENTRWNNNIQQAKQGPAASGFNKTAANPQLATWAYDVTRSLKPGQHGYQQAGTSNNWSAFNQGLAQAAPQQMQQQSAPAGVQPQQQQPTQANIPSAGFTPDGLKIPLKWVPGRNPAIPSGDPQELGFSSYAEMTAALQPQPQQPPQSGASSAVGSMLQQIAGPGYGGFQGGPSDMGAAQRMSQGISGPEFGGYQGGPSVAPAMDRMHAGITNPDYAGYQGGPSDQGATQKLMGGIAAGPDSGYREQDRTSEIVGATSRQYDQYGNPLNDAAQNKILANMDRQVQEGFGSDYLQQLSAAGMDPLKEAYDLALKKSNADMNRAGLAGSGFEFEAGYGSQPESITSRFLKEAGNVARDVGLRGAEAQREDRFRNASLQDAAVGQGMGLYSQQTDDQFRRLTTAGAQDLQRVNLLQGQDAQNEQSRQTWGNQALQRDLANMGFTSDAARLEYDKFKLGEDARRGWTDQDVATQGQNIDFANQAARLGLEGFQVDDQSRQGWYDRDTDTQGKNLDFANQGARLNADLYQIGDQAKQGWFDRDINLQQVNKNNLARSFDMATTMDQADLDQKKYWNEDDLARQKFDKENLSRGFDMANTLQGRDDEQDKYWNEDQYTRDNAAHQRLLDSTKLGMDYDQTNEANSQWNRNFLQGQAQTDFQNAADLWNKQTDYGFRDAERIDEARKFDIGHGFEVDKANQTMNQQGIQNLLQFYGLQGTAANQMQDQFWVASQKAGDGLVQNGLDRTAMGGWIGDLFNFGKQDPIAKPPVDSASKMAFGPMDPAMSDPATGPMLPGPMANRRYMPTRQY